MQDDTPDNEDELWNKMMEDVTPLSDMPVTVPKKCIKEKCTPPSSGYKSSPPIHTNKPIAKGLDHRTEQKLARGQITIEGRLDLHGMTQEQAHTQLIPFIISSYENKKRCVIVITGKGQGILQSKVPQWLELEPINNMVLKAVHAQPKDGGSGALYVYLRRQR